MECGDVNRLLDRWLDRELPDGLSGEFEAHLATCPACSRRHERLIALLASPAPVQVPAGLRERILAVVGDRATAPEGPALDVKDVKVKRAARAGAWGRWLWPGALAASLVLFALGWYSGRQWPKTQMPRPGGHGDMVLAEPNEEPQVTIVLSPWIMSSWAQAAAAGTPASPMLFVAQAAASEMMLAAWEEQPPVERCRPSIDPSIPWDEGDPELPQVPLIWPVQTPLGA